MSPGGAVARYSRGALPPYRYRPGRSPHPRRDPRGHSHGAPEPAPPRLDPGRWRESEAYRRAIDLYNHGYWWECHELFEGLWRAAGRDAAEGRFLQALIWAAAAHLQAEIGSPGGACRLAARAVARLAEAPDRTLGIDVPDLRRRLRARFEDGEPGPVRIVLR